MHILELVLMIYVGEKKVIHRKLLMLVARNTPNALKE